jgi:hypothetical protein
MLHINIIVLSIKEPLTYHVLLLMFVFLFCFILQWISREIELLRNRIDLANEKGWRREYPFMIIFLMLLHIKS